MSLRVVLDNERTVLFSKNRVFKTALFVKDTKGFRDLDLFLYLFGSDVFTKEKEVFALGEKRAQREGFFRCFKAETEDKEHSFFFCLKDDDLIFFKYLGREGFVRSDDARLSLYVKSKASLKVEPILVEARQADFSKLYLLSNSSSVHFPLLNEEQKGLVAIEDANVLVQGVAGSGKTNICIDKIIFSACRGYAGRVLYSTFSRGLLLDTQMRVNQFRQNLNDFVERFDQGRVVFADDDHKKAIENKLGIYFSADDDGKIIRKIKQVRDFLEHNVDFFLLEDLYSRYFNNGEPIEMAGESYFVKSYVLGIKNHQLSSKLDKVRHLSFEVIYKEIFGMINGCYVKGGGILPLGEYCQKRRESFSRYECEVIYSLALDFNEHLRKNKLLDNNLISRRLMEIGAKIPLYSLIVLDEVQDLTEVSLNLFKTIARKLFCVGDALQMINPSYFSFAYLKRLLFERDIISVAQLSHNYRSTERIAQLSESLGDINIRQFGTHSFVLKCSAVESDVPTLAAFVEDSSLLRLISEKDYNNFSVIVSGARQKEQLRRVLTDAEILTVAEVKGLERDVVILYNVLSANFEKWARLERMSVNRKTADENSVFRYYFNLFYVGLSRAKTHVYIIEDKQIGLFREFFRDNLVSLSAQEAARQLLQTSDKTQDEQDKLIERVGEFIRLEQLDNARFAANKIISQIERSTQLNKIEIYETLVYKGKNKEAGIRLWQAGLVREAQEQFSIAGEHTLLRLLNAATSGENKGLGIDIIGFLTEVLGNAAAESMILDLVFSDLSSVREKQNSISSALRAIKEEANG